MVTIYLKDGRIVQVEGSTVESNHSWLGLDGGYSNPVAIVVKDGDSVAAAFERDEVVGWVNDE